MVKYRCDNPKNKVFKNRSLWCESCSDAAEQAKLITMRRACQGGRKGVCLRKLMFPEAFDVLMLRFAEALPNVVVEETTIIHEDDA